MFSQLPQKKILLNGQFSIALFLGRPESSYSSINYGAFLIIRDLLVLSDAYSAYTDITVGNGVCLYYKKKHGDIAKALGQKVTVF